VRDGGRRERHGDGGVEGRCDGGLFVETYLLAGGDEQAGPWTVAGLDGGRGIGLPPVGAVACRAGPVVGGLEGEERWSAPPQLILERARPFVRWRGGGGGRPWPRPRGEGLGSRFFADVFLPAGTVNSGVGVQGPLE